MCAWFRSQLGSVAIHDSASFAGERCPDEPATHLSNTSVQWTACPRQPSTWTDAQSCSGGVPRYRRNKRIYGGGLLVSRFDTCRSKDKGGMAPDKSPRLSERLRRVARTNPILLDDRTRVGGKRRSGVATDRNAILVRDGVSKMAFNAGARRSWPRLLIGLHETVCSQHPFGQYVLNRRSAYSRPRTRRDS
jgi:hypothetical protein